MIRTTLLASFSALALLVTACGTDGDGSTGSTGSTTAPASTTNPTDGTGTGTGTGTDATGSSGETPTTGAAVCETDICVTYGAAVPAVAGQIVDKAAADPLFMADFAPLVAEGPAAVDAFKASLAAVISDAYGCSSGAYTGPTMQDAHKGQGITQSEYDAFIGLIVDVLTTNGVPESDINLCFAPPLVDPAFAATIIGQ